ncbi:hypothetical protein NDI45_22015 [Leptolyngbya sp. GB1-A1]|uniref:hypothetical protein n=1 Tax=Leptolyngbya sp. GB1-A1 TaxID=2933908 RepID=UPI00329A3EAB
MSNAFRSIDHNPQCGSTFRSAANKSPGVIYSPAYAEEEVRTVPRLDELDLSPAAVLMQQSVCVRLDWEDLSRFAIVDRQFEQWGVVFANAVAVCPSNPAYPPYSGTMAVMGAPKGGWLEARFLRPVKFVSSFVTSSRRTTLSAYDADDRLITSAKTPAPNLAYSDSECPPNVWLNLRNLDIHRVTFHAFDGQFILDDFCFCF